MPQTWLRWASAQGCGVSILCLRCVWTLWLASPELTITAIVSILCLRCWMKTRRATATSIKCFNSLFEMLEWLTEVVGYQPAFSFNSLFEMRQLARLLTARATPPVRFNSLFEMQRGYVETRLVDGVVVSILCLRCPAEPSTAAPRRRGCFNSLFEMPLIMTSHTCG